SNNGRLAQVVCCICSRPVMAHSVVRCDASIAVTIGGIADMPRSLAARWNDANDPGCVKTRNKITSAPQKNRMRGSGEFMMFPRTLAHINIAPEPSRKSFSHDQDPSAI